MDKFSSQQTYLTPVRISSRPHWLLICLCLIQITGCMVVRATPDTWNLEIQEEAPPPLPNLSLVRRVVPEVGTMFRTVMWKTDDAAREVSESRFGDPDEEANLSCVYTGLKEVLPGIDIVPTTTFWEQVAAPNDVIKLSKLFAAPNLDRLRAFQADVMVIAYDTEIDVETTKAFFVIAAFYSDTDKETAAVIVIDLHRNAIIHGSRVAFDDLFGIGYYFFPLGRLTLDPPDICNTVGRQAGAAIAEAMPGRAIRALVVVAGEDPYAAASRQ
jgi:hypothetical protein